MLYSFLLACVQPEDVGPTATSPFADPSGQGGPLDSAALASAVYNERDLTGSTLIALDTGVVPFQLLGLRYDQLTETPPVLLARARLTDGSYTDWSAVRVNWSGGVASNAVWEPGAFAERIELQGDIGALGHLVIELFAHTRPEISDPTSTTALRAAPLDSLVLPRSVWGAREGWCVGVQPAMTPEVITVHHTVTPTIDPLSPEQRLQQIQAYHMDVNGWCDIGYHYVVSGDGRVWEGGPDPLIEGIHTADHNDNNVGVAVLGSYHIDHPATVTLDGLAAIVDTLSETFGIPADSGHIFGHRDWNATECPGTYLYDELDAVVGAVAGGTVAPPLGTGLCLSDGALFCGPCPDLIDLEADYVASVVTCENGAASYEALEAQAIAARSYLFYSLEVGGSIVDGTAGQVYSCGTEPSAEAIAAATATAGQVLYNELDQIIAAFYVAGTLPSSPSCYPVWGDLDPTGTEWAVTYQTEGGPPVSSPLGSLGNPKNRGCKSQNGADCLSDGGSSETDILTRYYKYASLKTAALPCPGEVATPPTTCPYGDGAYCGLTVGLDPNGLYQCTSGSFTLAEACGSGCTVEPPGTADHCAPDSGETPPAGGSCPFGDGAYCGDSVGLESGVLYECSGGNYWEVEDCSWGCVVEPPGFADHCDDAPATSGTVPADACPSGDGLYCGDAWGYTSGVLYWCAGGTFYEEAVCALGCVQNPPGVADACAWGSCPYGDGLYCGDGWGLEAGVLYDCNAAAWTEVEDCPGSCVVQPPGWPDYCG